MGDPQRPRTSATAHASATEKAPGFPAKTNDRMKIQKKGREAHGSWVPLMVSERPTWPYLANLISC